jgi:hypothetical protein
LRHRKHPLFYKNLVPDDWRVLSGALKAGDQFVDALGFFSEMRA